VSGAKIVSRSKSTFSLVIFHSAQVVFFIRVNKQCIAKTLSVLYKKNWQKSSAQVALQVGYKLAREPIMSLDNNRKSGFGVEK
jgi:hypothetical protein